MSRQEQRERRAGREGEHCAQRQNQGAERVSDATDDAAQLPPLQESTVSDCGREQVA